MTNVKNALKGEAGAIVLMAAAEIRASIKKVGDLGAEFASTLHMTGVQTLLHAEKHGDCTLALELVLSVKDNVPGYVWQGLVSWFRKYSPIHFYVDDAGKNAVRLLKADEKGYKPFNSADADANPAAEDQAVKKRTDTKIEPFSIKLAKKRIQSLLSQAEKADKDGGRGFEGDTPEAQAKTRHDTIVFLKRVSLMIENIKVIDEAPAAPAPAEAPKQEAAA